MKQLLLSLFAASLLAAPALARDFGPGGDVAKVKTLVRSMVGPVVHTRVSHDWALCIATADGNDISILLHRNGGKWKAMDQDGGAWGTDVLRVKGVPAADATVLHKIYQ